MEAQLRCQCGQTLVVSQGAAGAKVSCRCGRSVAVPSLRELRRRAAAESAVPSPELVVKPMPGKDEASSNSAAWLAIASLCHMADTARWRCDLRRTFRLHSQRPLADPKLGQHRPGSSRHGPPI
jgi:Domain of unknown function (DUF1922)